MFRPLARLSRQNDADPTQLCHWTGNRILGLLAGALIPQLISDSEFAEGLGMGLMIGATVTILYELYLMVGASRRQSQQPAAH